MLPLWTTPKGTTYSDVVAFCKARYSKYGKKLIAKVSECINSSGIDALILLNNLSIELSCYNPIWNDFSLAVFERILLPKSSNSLVECFETTLRRLSHGSDC